MGDSSWRGEISEHAPLCMQPCIVRRPLHSPYLDFRPMNLWCVFYRKGTGGNEASTGEQPSRQPPHHQIDPGDQQCLRSLYHPQYCQDPQVKGTYMNNHVHRALLRKRKKERSSKETEYRKEFYVQTCTHTQTHTHIHTCIHTSFNSLENIFF